MWFFKSPEIIYGEDALEHLTTLTGRCAVIVTDRTLVQIGHAGRVQKLLETAGLSVHIYDSVEPDPSLETVQAGAAELLRIQPDWIIGLGGGSCLDAAKGMWVLYERPDVDAQAINPMESLGLRQKARFAAIPTTSGTGSEATWAIVLTNKAERRKMGLGSREAIADLAILDPSLVMRLPPRVTADTGLDALTHAVEGYTCMWHNDFSDGLCLQAARLVFQYLPQAYQAAQSPLADAGVEARTHMHNAAAIAGLGFGNAMASLAHGIGHALGGVFHIPHGRAVSLALPYTIEYCVRGDPDSTRYAGLAAFLGLAHSSEQEAAAALAGAIRDLERSLGQPLDLQACGITRAALEGEMGLLVDNANSDTQTVTSTRIPGDAEFRRLFESMWAGTPIDF
jgi:alcohol dehydrogenase class IV